MRILVTALTSLSVSLVAISLPAFAVTEEKVDPPSIIVQGEGKVYAKPDLASVAIGVVTEASTARQALAANSTAMSNLMKTIADTGIESRDVQTSNFSVSPTYTSDSTHAPRIHGYSVQNSVNVRIHKIPQVGPLLDAVVESGANRVDGVTFSIDETSRLLDEARTKAIADAKRKASVYAAAAGVQLGKVLYVIEGGGGSAPIRPMFRTMAASMAPTTPISSGEEELSVSATVVFSIN